jgi:DNA-binding SARP family transcriptional activator
MKNGVVDEERFIRRRLTIPLEAQRAVARPRLTGLIERGLAERQVVLVIAAPGSGKTTAVATAARATRLPVVWLTLDQSDVMPGRLLTYLAAAFELRFAGVAATVTQAIARGLSHREVAGLMVDALGGAGALVVLDETERLGADPGGWGIVEAMLRSAQPGVRFVLIGRGDVPASLCDLPPDHALLISDRELAFTTDEAAAALVSRGADDVDAEQAVATTSGWVTGVLFEVWRLDGHIPGAGGEVDPLFGYLSVNVLAQLDARLRDVLITTSVLDEVSVADSRALGVDDAESALAELAAAHLPATWISERRALRCHPRFREYLLELLGRRGPAAVAVVRRAHARHLEAQGLPEDAAEEFLAAGAFDDAVAPAAAAIVAVVERGDLRLAKRWFDQLGARVHADHRFSTGRLMLAVASYDLGQAIGLADELAQRGERAQVAASSEEALALMVWAYLHQGRLDDVEAVLAAGPPSVAADTVRHSARVVLAHDNRGRLPSPELTGGPLDAVILIADYCLGRLTNLAAQSALGWAEMVARPWIVAALRASGQTRRALQLYEEVSREEPAFKIFVGADLLMDAGLPASARETLATGRRLALASGSLGMMGLNTVSAIRMAFRLDHDVVLAQALIDRFEDESGRQFGYFAEFLDLASGWLALMSGRNADALDNLRRAVRSMVASDRILELPQAAICLAEAEGRAENEERADAAADLALDAARRQGSYHLLLQALGDMPDVLGRRLDGVPGPDSPWHALARALRAQGVAVVKPAEAIHLSEFGKRTVLVDGVPVRPRIAKATELLAFMIAAGRREYTRAELGEALFDGRDDRSSRAYLSQAIHQLRAVLPMGALEMRDHALVLRAGASSDSAILETVLAEAARLRGEDRTAAVLASLEVVAGGAYLPGPRGTWADDRERVLLDLITDARASAAENAYQLSRLQEAQQLIELVLETDPFREDSTRLAMRNAAARADTVGVVGVYRRCRDALATIGVDPSPATRDLLDTLRS